MLPERISLYDGRSANATIRMRGYILAAFEQTGLPEAALPYVLEELENGRDAYLTAGAARALRGLDTPTSLSPCCTSTKSTFRTPASSRSHNLSGSIP